MFSDGQAVTANGASTNVIDLGATGTVLNAPAALVRDIGKGNPIEIVIQIDAAAGGTNPTLNAAIQVDDNEGFSSPTTVASGDLVGTAAGSQVSLYYMPQNVNERYVRLNYTVGGTSTVYAVSAFVALAADQNSGVAGA